MADAMKLVPVEPTPQMIEHAVLSTTWPVTYVRTCWGAMLAAAPTVPLHREARFDVETYVENYEFRSDEGDHTPDDNERGMLIDAIHGVLSELTIVSPPAREEAPAEGVVSDRRKLLARWLLDSRVPEDMAISQVAFHPVITDALRNRTSEPEAGAVAWQRKRPEGLGGYAAWVDCDIGDIPHYRRMGQEIRALFTHPAPASADKLRVAAKAVVLAAWTDRHSRLHGHEIIAALDAALNEGGE